MKKVADKLYDLISDPIKSTSSIKRFIGQKLEWCIGKDEENRLIIMKYATIIGFYVDMRDCEYNVKFIKVEYRGNEYNIECFEIFYDINKMWDYISECYHLVED